jgi:hypothetical protein
MSDTGITEEDFKAYFNETVEEVQRSLLKLRCLEECGVDNWEGYGESMQLFQDRV